MRRVFVETSAFTKKVDAEGREALLLIQGELLERLESSPVIPGTGGLRKLRVPNAAKGKGKRGGYRVIYLDLPGIERTYLLGLYGKGEKADLAQEEKKVLKGLVERLRREVL
jgi:mRNA-degrading endonuclease RelE of RelBE toxin-antitoxin system